MTADQVIAARVSTEMKAQLRTLAEQQQLSESALLKRVLEMALHGADVRGIGNSERDPRTVRAARLYVRLRPEDQLLLRERAAARGMAAATYISVLVRSHLRNLPPLPRDEYMALKRSVAELEAIGRNLNQIARAANQGYRLAGLGREELRAMLKVCEGLRDHVKGLLRANVSSWGIGHAEANS